MALYDLMAKHLDIPLVDMLGPVHGSMLTSITIGIMSPKESALEAREYIDQGFRILKVKIGKSLEEDIECLTRIRECAGRDIRIRVDANQGYSMLEYKQFIQAVQAIDLEFIEQPLQAGNIAHMQDLPEAIRAVTAADESLLGPKQALEYTHPPQPFGIYNIKLMKSGGIYPALQIADIAHLAGIELMWGCMDESVIGIAAALHAALASPATRYLDLDGSLDLARDIAKEGFVLKNGALSVTQQPGLGIKRI
jgi:L-Ala-D/L-Glu epimerase